MADGVMYLAAIPATTGAAIDVPLTERRQFSVMFLSIHQGDALLQAVTVSTPGALTATLHPQLLQGAIVSFVSVAPTAMTFS